MTTNLPIDIASIILCSIGIGVIVGVLLTQRSWVAECRKRKLIRNDASTGKLVWRDGGEEVP